jgi:hypothetical protein
MRLDANLECLAVMIFLAGSSALMGVEPTASSSSLSIRYVEAHIRAKGTPLPSHRSLIAYEAPAALLVCKAQFLDTSKLESVSVFQVREEASPTSTAKEPLLGAPVVLGPSSIWLVAVDQATSKCYGLQGFGKEDRAIINDWSNEMAPVTFSEHPELLLNFIAWCQNATVAKDYFDVLECYLARLNDACSITLKKDALLSHWQKQNRRRLQGILHAPQVAKVENMGELTGFLTWGEAIHRIEIRWEGKLAPQFQSEETVLSWSLP